MATAFTGAGGRKTLILLNRSTETQKVEVRWKGAEFGWRETASPREENSVEAMTRTDGRREVEVPPGAIVTLTNVELGKAGVDMERA